MLSNSSTLTHLWHVLLLDWDVSLWDGRHRSSVRHSPGDNDRDPHDRLSAAAISSTLHQTQRTTHNDKVRSKRDSHVGNLARPVAVDELLGDIVQRCEEGGEDEEDKEAEEDA